MQDSTKIRLLSGYAAGATAAVIGMGWMCYQFGQQYEKDKQKKAMGALVISKFVEVSPVETCQKVLEEVEFTWITSHLKDLEKMK